MKYVATFDIGTTAVKGVLVSAARESVMESSHPVTTIYKGDRIEQDPNGWYEGFCKISAEFLAHVEKSDILGIVMSGQMQDLIALDGAGNPVCDAILYSDGRAGAQAAEIERLLGAKTILGITGNGMDGSIPLAKLLWFKQNDPEGFGGTHKFVFSSKDAVIARLTGNYCSDVTCCSTVGLMRLSDKTWMKEWLALLGMDGDILPQIKYPEELAGTVTEQAAAESGYLPGTPVYAGTGDAGATTMASGILKAGEFNINLGTSGWVARISNAPVEGPGVFNLASMERDLYINVVPFMNAGSVHKWVSKTLAPDFDEKGKYAYGDRLLEESRAGSGGVLFLPYITGERFPVLDNRVRGAYFNITPETTKQDLMRAALEGVAFSIRQGLESFAASPDKISLIGGGAKTPVWCQIFADVLGRPVTVYENSEFLPSLAIASAVLIDLGFIESYGAFIRSLNQNSAVKEYMPDLAAKKLYDSAYQKYLLLYPAIKDKVLL